MKSFEAFALEDFPRVKSGDSISKITAETAAKNGIELEDGDVLVIAQKIFSKAENRIVNQREVVPTKRAKEISKITGKNAKFVELILRETKRIVKASSEVLLVEDTRGMICINAGIDRSNVEGTENLTLLPETPDKSAERCRLELKEATGRNVAVVISDTFSRPFRRGQVNFAVGIAGIAPLKDYRGKRDMFDRILRVKNVAVVDEVAAAAELLMGQGREATPVIILRGLKDAVKRCEECSLDELQISSQEDLFRNTVCL